MCDHLKLKLCAQLSRSGTLGPYTIAKEFLNQNDNACWENIVRHLCQDFYIKRLAREIADNHNIPFEEYCGKKHGTL